MEPDSVIRDSGNEDDGNLSSASAFDDLLARLAEEHEKEIHVLRQEVTRLQRFCGDASRALIKPEFAEPDVPAAPGTPLQAQSFPVISAADKECTMETDTSKPDGDALMAAFANATHFDDDGFDENEGIPRSGTQDGSNGFHSSPLRLEEMLGDHGANEATDSVDSKDVYASSLMVESCTIGGLGGLRPGSLVCWEKMIKAVKLKQTVEALPKIKEIWIGVEEANEKERGLTIDVLIATAAKASRFVEGQDSLDKISDVPRSFVHFWQRLTLWMGGFLQSLMMHPTCRRRVSWDMIGMMLLFHDLIFIPMQVYFAPHTDGLPVQYEDFLKVLDFFGASFWTCDIFVSFRTGYYSEEGFVELRPSKIARLYLKTWFGMDLCIVAADWSSMAFGASSASGFMRLGKTVSRFLRVLRLLRFLKMNNALKELMERVNSEYLLQVIGILKTLMVIIIIAHYIACSWFYIGTREFVSVRWPEKFLVNYQTSFSYAYSTSLHWSLTQFTPASMEVVPQNTVERFFVVVVIIMALVAFSSFVSSITAAMTHIRQINAQKMQLESKVRQFFAEHKISHHMASRVWHFLRKNKLGFAKRLKESDIPAFTSLPIKIKEDLRLEIFLPILAVHPLFCEYAKREKRGMLKICNHAISELFLINGEEAFPHSLHATHMIFVAMGTLEYNDSGYEIGSPEHSQMDIEKRHFVRTGEWACEVCLWADRAELAGPLVSSGGLAELIMLDAAAFQGIALREGESAVFVAKYAELFMEEFTEVCKVVAENPKDEDVNMLFNDPGVIEEIVFDANDALGKKDRMSAWADSIGMGQGIGRASHFSPLGRGSRGSGKARRGSGDNARRISEASHVTNSITTIPGIEGLRHSVASARQSRTQAGQIALEV